MIDKVKRSGIKFNSIRYAKDTVLIADLDLGLQINNVNTSCGQFETKINVRKTKVNFPLPIQINRELLEQAERLKYL